MAIKRRTIYRITYPYVVGICIFTITTLIICILTSNTNFIYLHQSMNPVTTINTSMYIMDTVKPITFSGHSFNDQKWKILIKNIIIDDHVQNDTKLRLFGVIPFQLLSQQFWINEATYSDEYCQTNNHCIINHKVIIKQLVLQKIKSPQFLVLENLSCIVHSLQQNHFHLMKMRTGDRDYAIVSIDCKLYDGIDQTLYQINQFALELSYNINTTFYGGEQISNCLSHDIQRNISKMFGRKFKNIWKNDTKRHQIIEHFHLFSKQFLNFGYNKYKNARNDDQKLEIRWNKRKSQKIGNIAICSTATFGFPAFIALWIQHHLNFSFIEDIFIYVNYKHIAPEYTQFLMNFKEQQQYQYMMRNKLKFINWTISNELPDRKSSFYEFQQLAYLQCLYENMYSYKWILFLDSDDFLMVLNQNKFLNYIENIHRNYSIHSIIFLWIGWNYCCIYPYLEGDNNDNLDLKPCQFPNKIGQIFGKYMTKPTYVLEPGTHHIEEAINNTNSIDLAHDRAKHADFVYIRHGHCRSVLGYKLNDIDIQCQHKLHDYQYILEMNNHWLLNYNKIANVTFEENGKWKRCKSHKK